MDIRALFGQSHGAPAPANPRRRCLARSRKFRLALASVYGVGFREEGYEDLSAAVQEEVRELESWIASTKSVLPDARE
jgi:hypothetical protein